MKHTLKTGLSFGLTSGIITTLGLLVGLSVGTQSRIVVIGGILTIAIADALSDALGIHFAEESEGVHSAKEIWEATIFTFLFKFIFALTFVAPVVFLPLTLAVVASIVLGLSLLGIFSFYLAKNQKVAAGKVVAEHLTIAILVIVATYYVGIWVASLG